MSNKCFECLVRLPTPSGAKGCGLPWSMSWANIGLVVSGRAYGLVTLGHRFNSCPGHSLVELLGVLFSMGVIPLFPVSTKLHYLLVQKPR